MSKKNTGRRDFLKKLTYAAPAILTLQASSAFARLGSGRPGIKPYPLPNPRPRPIKKKVVAKKKTT